MAQRINDKLIFPTFDPDIVRRAIFGEYHAFSLKSGEVLGRVLDIKDFDGRQKAVVDIDGNQLFHPNSFEIALLGVFNDTFQ